MFVQKLSQVIDQLRRAPLNSSVQDYIFSGIKLWCNQLDLPQNITNYILKHYQQWSEIQNITNYLWDEWRPREIEEKNIFGFIKAKEMIQSRLNNLIALILKPTNIRVEKIEFSALVAFAVTAVGYVIYAINHSEHKLTDKEEIKNYTSNFSDSLLQLHQRFLVLVIAAEKASLIQSIKEKKRINYNDGEELYEITKYLWLGTESAFNKKIPNIQNYLVIPGKESEYDIYLVYLKIQQSDEGFKPSVNQLDRYDAFRQLPDLILNFEISPRLQMEAYSNFEVYTR